MAAAAPSYQIAAVSRLTGLSIDTLRAWERRYGVVKPRRGDRGRRYSEADVQRLSELADLVRSGHSIGAVAALPSTARRKLLGSTASELAPSPPSTVELDPLMRDLKRYNIDGIEAALNRYSVLLPPEELVFGVMLPLLRETGKRWECGTMQPAQEHLLSAVIRSVLGGLLRTRPKPHVRGVMLFATPKGERHELGLLAAAVLAAQAGMATTYLGADLPAADIARAAAAAGADTIVLSATARAEVGFDDAVAFRRLPSSIRILLGGPESAALQQIIGRRAHVVNSLEVFKRAIQTESHV